MRPFADFLDGMVFIARVSASAAAMPHRFRLSHYHRHISPADDRHDQHDLESMI